MTLTQWIAMRCPRLPARRLQGLLPDALETTSTRCASATSLVCEHVRRDAVNTQSNVSPEPHEYARDFPEYLRNPVIRKRNAWSYIDARDLGQICHLCIEKGGLGFQVFNATNTTASLSKEHLPVEKFLQENCPKSPITRKMGEIEAPLSNRKAREVLGFVEQHDWRNYVKE